ncbi:MAG: symmetrical bis(5'-nucleosyl)-tetraphosphatase [Pseudomonadota bacterium]
MAVYAIGDIQGCLDELEDLLAKIAYSEDRDQLWFVGDLVNRGPRSLDTLRFVKSLPDTVVVLGNHDLNLLAAAYSARKPGRGDTIKPVLKAPDRDELLEWLRGQKLFHRDHELAISMCHAGLPPQWDVARAERRAAEVEEALRGPDFVGFLDNMYGDEPRRWDKSLSGYERLRFITNCLTRLRYCSAKGRLALKQKGSPEEQGGGKWLPWFDVPGRRSEGQRIVFGHWSTLGLLCRDDLYAIDTGCLWGGHLTALRLDTAIPQIFQVPSRDGIEPL